MEAIQYIKKLFSWVGPEDSKKRRANFDDEFSEVMPKLRRLSSGLDSNPFRKERLVPIKLCDQHYQRRSFNSMSTSRSRSDFGEKGYVEISDDEDDVHLVDDTELHPHSFYKREKQFRPSSFNIIQDGGNGIDDNDDDDDDILYVTCQESNESKAKRLGYKYFKSRVNNSPVICKNSLIHHRKSPLVGGFVHRPVFTRDKMSRSTPKLVRGKFTLNESVRLDEKRKYHELLKQYAPSFGSTPKSFIKCSNSLGSEVEKRERCSLFSNLSVYKTPTDGRSRSRKILDSVLNSNDDLRDDFIDLTHQNGLSANTSAKSPIFNIFKSNINHKSSPVVNDVSATNGDTSKPHKSPDKKRDSVNNKPEITCEISSKDSASDSEVEIIPSTSSTKSEISPDLDSTPIRTVIDSKPICSAKWIQDMRNKHTNSQREKQLKIQEVKLRKDLHSEHNRKIFGATLEDRIRRSLTISEPIEIIEDLEPEPEPFPELTKEQQTLINRALTPNPPNDVLAQKFNMNITRRDIHSLAGLNWLNDEVINFYMNLIMERGKQDNKPKVYATNTFFYPKLMSGGHQSLRRWTKKVDIFAHDIMLIPVHLDVHWCMALIDFRDKTIRYYDSMGSHNTRCVEALLQYLVEERMDKKKEKFDKSGWSLNPCKDIPQQMNGSDCGMFSCTFAEFYTRDAKFTFSQEDMPYLRRKMVLEIILGKLLIN